MSNLFYIFRSVDKRVTSSKGSKSDEAAPSSSPPSDKTEKKDIKSEPVSESDKESKDKDSKSAKKRKGNSRTPTPVQSEVSVVVSAAPVSDIAGTSSTVLTTSAATLTQTDKKNSISGGDNTAEKLKRVINISQIIIIVVEDDRINVLQWNLYIFPSKISSLAYKYK